MESQLDFTFQKGVNSPVGVYIQKSGINNLSVLLGTRRPDKVFVVCDTNIERLYAKSAISTIEKQFEVHILTHPADEQNKNMEILTSLSNAFFENGGTANSCICALGGGITGNIAGLLAALVYRGIDLIHIPTTLLAQLDSAVDVKQSVNAPGIKNAIGAYKAPLFVIVDPEFLTSLNDREIRSGLGESVKHGFAQDLKLVDAVLEVNRNDLDSLEGIIHRTIELKIDHWNNTPTIWNESHKVERLTHLGHTTGKVLEMIELDYLTHGEAIAHGMVIEAWMSHILGNITIDDVMYIKETLMQIGLLYPLTDSYTSESIMSSLYKSENSPPLFALLKELGNPETISTHVSKQVFQQALSKYGLAYNEGVTYRPSAHALRAGGVTS